MTRSGYVLPAAALGALALAAPASAQSYMQQCNALIDAWSACAKSGESCEAQYSAIEERCKCHTYRRGEWVLVDAAVADDNVCGSPPGDTIIPPPPPPPPYETVREPRGGGGGGEEPGPDDRDGGDPPADESPGGHGGAATAEPRGGDGA